MTVFTQGLPFAQRLQQQSEPFWTQATTHVFIEEMVDNRLSNKAFAHYLIQDYIFVNDLVDLISHCIVFAQTMKQKYQLSHFLSMITSDENDYFLRSFQVLDVSEQTHSNAKLSPVMQRFQLLIKQTIRTSKESEPHMAYAQCLSLFLCAESVYCQWGLLHKDKAPEHFYFNEWLVLHNNQYFEDFVSWLKQEANSFVDFTDDEQAKLTNIFQQTCELEALFFDECYAVASSAI